MKHKTDELTEALLDAAVAMAEGKKFELLPHESWSDGSGITFVNSKPVCRVGLSYYKPSRLWEHGGPLIERERICVDFFKNAVHGQYWSALPKDDNGCEIADPDPKNHERMSDGWWPLCATGATPLEAAMRAFVKSRLGNEVDLA